MVTCTCFLAPFSISPRCLLLAPLLPVRSRETSDSGMRGRPVWRSNSVVCCGAAQILQARILSPSVLIFGCFIVRHTVACDTQKRKGELCKRL